MPPIPAQPVMTLALSFIFGAVVGSFLNVVLLRKNTGESVIFNGSRCFSCGKKLAWWQNIPILSFIFLRGKCFYCGSKISWQYPIVELSVGLLAVLIYLKNFYFSAQGGPALGWQFWYYFAAFATLFLVAAYDFRRKIIDSHFLYFFGAFSLAEFFRMGGFANNLISSFFIAIFFYLLWRFSGGRWMGRGDANLAFFTSLFLGWPFNLAMLLVSFWLGGLVGVFLLLFRRGRYGLRSEIPFGPFLAAAMFCVWYFADFLREFYGIIF